MKNELTVKQFRSHLESLFKNYTEILEKLPSFFSETGDVNLTSKATLKGSGKKLNL